MFSTYRPEDVTILLKDISGMVDPLPAKVREVFIQSGVHYSEMLPLEYEPSSAYLDAYEKAVALYSRQTAQAVANASSLSWFCIAPLPVQPSTNWIASGECFPRIVFIAFLSIPFPRMIEIV